MYMRKDSIVTTPTAIPPPKSIIYTSTEDVAINVRPNQIWPDHRPRYRNQTVRVALTLRYLIGSYFRYKSVRFLVPFHYLAC